MREKMAFKSKCTATRKLIRLLKATCCASCRKSLDDAVLEILHSLLSRANWRQMTYISNRNSASRYSQLTVQDCTFLFCLPWRIICARTWWAQLFTYMPKYIDLLPGYTSLFRIIPLPSSYFERLFVIDRKSRWLAGGYPVSHLLWWTDRVTQLVTTNGLDWSHFSRWMMDELTRHR